MSIQKIENQLGLDSMLSKLCKLSIICAEDEKPGGSVTCTYNPKDVSFSKSVKWTPDSQGFATDYPALQFTGGEAITATLELFFDKYEQKQDVRGDISTLVSFCLRHPQKNPRDLRPPRVQLIWGAQEILTGMNFSSGVITQVQVKYTMFLPDGTPCRATASVSIQQANIVSSSGGGSGSDKIVTFSSATEAANYPGGMAAAEKAGIHLEDQKGAFSVSMAGSGSSESGSES